MKSVGGGNTVVSIQHTLDSAVQAPEGGTGGMDAPSHG